MAEDVRAASPHAKSTRVPELDGLRGFAILFVLLWHCVFSTFRGTHHSVVSFFVAFLGLGWSGVDLFFVLSGFLIGGILLDARSSPKYFKTFYVRRFFRIVPLYAIVVASFFLTKGLMASSRLSGLDWLYKGSLPWFCAATFTQNIWTAAFGGFGGNWLGVTWSLAVEEQFYLTLPWVVRYLSPGRLLRVAVAVIVAAPLLRALLGATHLLSANAGYVLMPCRADALMLGVLAALLLRRPDSLRFISEHQSLLLLLLCVQALGLGAYRCFCRNGCGTFSLLIGSIEFTWLGVFYFCALLLAATQQGKPVTRVLRMRWLTGLGSIAYCVYLIHELLNGLCYVLIRGHEPYMAATADIATGAAALGLTLLIAKGSWVLFEKPLIKLGHSFTY